MTSSLQREKFLQFLNSLPFGESRPVGKVVQQFDNFSNLIHQYNDQFGLVSKNDLDSIWLRHFQDSLMVMKLFPHIFPSLGDRGNRIKVVDVGSGSGFPGVPLAIVNPMFDFLLLEPNKKRYFFLEQILLRSLSLSCVKVRGEMVKYTVKQHKSREKFDILVTRAVENFKDIVSMTLPLIKENGFGLYWVGADILFIEELEKTISSKYRCKVELSDPYSMDREDEKKVKAIILIKKGAVIQN